MWEGIKKFATGIWSDGKAVFNSDGKEEVGLATSNNLVRRTMLKMEGDSANPKDVKALNSFNPTFSNAALTASRTSHANAMSIGMGVGGVGIGGYYGYKGSDEKSSTTIDTGIGALIGGASGYGAGRVAMGLLGAKRQQGLLATASEGHIASMRNQP